MLAQFEPHLSLNLITFYFPQHPDNYFTVLYLGCCKLENEILKEAKNAQK